MPTFYTESLDIDPEEFVDDCSPSEIQELVNYLKESELRATAYGMMLS